MKDIQKMVDEAMYAAIKAAYWEGFRTALAELGHIPSTELLARAGYLAEDYAGDEVYGL